MSFAYSKSTHDVVITVRPVYLEQESSPDEAHYVWAYHVNVTNKSNQTLQLINRYWHITDGNGLVQEVHGPGVVGQQPVLAPGDEYEYASGTHLATPSGIMHGHYEMLAADSKMLKIEIPAFSLDSAELVQRPH